MPYRIKSIKARQIADSRGNPTIEVVLATEQGEFLASVPSGVSRGEYEAKTVPVPQALKNIEQIIGPKLLNKAIGQQKGIDQLLLKLDGREDKSNLGANTILAVSAAAARAAAAASNLPLYQYIGQLTGVGTLPVLPRPCFNVIEGGVHTQNNLDIQEFMVVPGFQTFEENLKAGEGIYCRLKQILEKKFGKVGIKLGDEGGFSPPLKKTEEALDLLMQVITQFLPSRKMCYLALDCAASQFYKGGVYPVRGFKARKKTQNAQTSNGVYQFERKKKTAQELLNFYKDLSRNYPILFFEDPFAQDDWSAWKQKSKHKPVASLPVIASQLSKSQKSKILFIGDDLTVTNPERIKLAKQKNACRGIVIKPNQIGTITETIEAAKLAKKFGWKIVVSHRSAETKDDFIADLSVGISADFIKAGAPAPQERMAKYKRLLKIEKEL